jgi:hypothetical protein
MKRQMKQLKVYELTENHMKLFFYSLYYDMLDNPKRDFNKLLKQKLKEDFNCKYYEYNKNKKQEKTK